MRDRAEQSSYIFAYHYSWTTKLHHARLMIRMNVLICSLLFIIWSELFRDNNTFISRGCRYYLVYCLVRRVLRGSCDFVRTTVTSSDVFEVDCTLIATLYTDVKRTCIWTGITLRPTELGYKCRHKFISIAYRYAILQLHWNELSECRHTRTHTMLYRDVCPPAFKVRLHTCD